MQRGPGEEEKNEPHAAGVMLIEELTYSSSMRVGLGCSFLPHPPGHETCEARSQEQHRARFGDGVAVLQVVNLNSPSRITNKDALDPTRIYYTEESVFGSFSSGRSISDSYRANRSQGDA